ncbi:MAG: AbrB/MazE/SpoVT family DNA-binding domain-containing protein [Acidobacteria bacterium]|nr:AbrB/MazE/SpoVT family DNA-binding domain-containing protein [Acidobacteriota bacterium]
MAKVSSKFQVTVPKAIAEKYSIRPGDTVNWIASGNVIQLVPVSESSTASREARLRSFDLVTKRIAARRRSAKAEVSDRGWRREDLYQRGFPR